jgi:lipid A ethanolaminephosphotransferase
MFEKIEASTHRTALNPLLLSALVSFWLVLSANWSLWKGIHYVMPIVGPRQWLFIGCSGLSIFALLWLLFSAFSFRPIIKGVLGIFVLMATACSYFMSTYGVVIDEGMILNSLHTDPSEVRDLLSVNMLVTFALIALPALIFIVKTPLKRIKFFKQGAMNLAAMALALVLALGSIFAMYQDFASLMRNNKELRFQVNPLNALWALGLIASAPLRQVDSRLQTIGLDAKQNSNAAAGKPKLIIYILGETARSVNFSLNGYGRLTNPQLSQLDVVSFRNVASCGTSTAASLPCMFSPLGREAHLAFLKKFSNSEGLLDVLKKAGIKQLWIDNNSGCKGACDRIANQDVATQAHPTLCNTKECFDEILLENFESNLAKLGSPSNTMITLHQKGSHGPAYFLRTPEKFKVFKPECVSNQLQTCEQSTIVNAYDNTLVYTDHVIAQSIALLKKLSATYDTGLIYVSDHGESLGENNTYLHGLPYAFAPKVQKHVPLIAWFSEGLQKRLALNLDCLKKQASQEISHDYLFHSLLTINQVETSLYRKDRDIFALCSN